MAEARRALIVEDDADSRAALTLYLKAAVSLLKASRKPKSGWSGDRMR